ncbi:M14 family metallopeptidase [Kibdelosporangium persicum]|uniref:Murein tripeptide amidase MpaA n=1 Tax=Kibdelosporangium persicum TaxID=2698649 RepID=A0ABX2EXK8_9PSEU|nr:M14 family metallopeptidase [Kibdelosporangium persicum]NRN63771.1 Murein tripeptide amidase MpaA [Kibdelosporangium persicum]
MRSRRGLLAAAALGAAMLLPLPITASAQPEQSTAAVADSRPSAIYTVENTTPVSRTAISRFGVDIHGTDGGTLTFAATASQAKALREAGFRLTQQMTTLDFPPADSMYHNYAEQTTELQKIAADHSSIARLSSIGKSYQNRDLWLLKISDNAATDESEPEVLFTCQQHAREHLTPEMCLRIANRYTDGYGSDAAITNEVNSKEIWIVTSVNPDGSEYDIATGSYRSWRKNRQPNAGSSNVGTDLNRNWGFQWGCCGGSSGSTGSETYRGPSAFSAPETQRLRDFVNSRVVGGVQQIKTHIDWHTYSELILWPFGYTYNNTAPGLDANQERAFRTLGQQMAQTNNYTPQQSSDLYVTDGSIGDWMWGAHKIWSYTFEMYPRSGGGGFYPPDEVIVRETSRNDRAVALFLSYSDCVPRVIGGSC